jgi:hypothetical protein
VDFRLLLDDFTNPGKLVLGDDGFHLDEKEVDI